MFETTAPVLLLLYTGSKKARLARGGMWSSELSDAHSRKNNYMDIWICFKYGRRSGSICIRIAKVISTSDSISIQSTSIPMVSKPLLFTYYAHVFRLAQLHLLFTFNPLKSIIPLTKCLETLLIKANPYYRPEGKHVLVCHFCDILFRFVLANFTNLCLVNLYLYNMNLIPIPDDLIASYHLQSPDHRIGHANGLDRSFPDFKRF